MTARPASAAGFTIVELLVAAAITCAVTAAVLGLIDPARGIFQAQPEVADMHQRLRVAVDVLTRDLVMAGAGLESSAVAPVMPYRVGERDSDRDLGVSFRPDAISILYVPWAETTIASHTYYLKSDLATNTFQLMQYDGLQTDLPVVDHVVKLEFQYFGDDDTPLDPIILQDGPWIRDDRDATFDADLLRIRRVRVLIRVQAALASMRGSSGLLFARGGTSTSAQRYVPDAELQFDVAPRNMNLNR